MRIWFELKTLSNRNLVLFKSEAVGSMSVFVFAVST